MKRETQKSRMMLAASMSFIVTILISGCATNAKTGSLIGAGVGAAAGQWIGKDTEGTLIGAGVGAAAGYMIGNEADKEESREDDDPPSND